MISRGVPIAKALENEALIAWGMNGAPVPALHGAPLRLVCGGRPGSMSGKWLTELLVRDRVHDGARMTGDSYRVPCRPVAPRHPGRRLGHVHHRVHAREVFDHRSGLQSECEVDAPFEVRGHAWARDLAVARLETSIDFGTTWQPAELAEPPNRLAWQRWRSSTSNRTVSYC